MSKLDGINTDMSGKIGKYVYRRTKNGTVVAQAPRRYEVPRRSEKQMYLRCQMGNAAAFFRLFDDLLLEGFEGKPEGTNEFNMFVKANYGKNPVFITQDMRMDGACVVAPYTFTNGSLVCVGYDVNASGVLVSDLSLGTLVIGAGTTVAELAMAVIRNNAGWQDQDQLTFFYARQWFDASGTPRASMLSWKVVLDVSDESPLLSVVNQMGFTSVSANGGYVLGMGAVLERAGAALGTQPHQGRRQHTCGYAEDAGGERHLGGLPDGCRHEGRCQQLRRIQRQGRVPEPQGRFRLLAACAGQWLRAERDGWFGWFEW